ncbi:MAG: hypothetical protein JWN00_5064 [Actinomycetia bacterium]|jgi:hypothetical protein|nr:hypothetical protein [Actinomycetes bacterium]
MRIAIAAVVGALLACVISVGVVQAATSAKKDVPLQTLNNYGTR